MRLGDKAGVSAANSATGLVATHPFHGGHLAKSWLWYYKLQVCVGAVHWQQNRRKKKVYATMYVCVCVDC